MNARNLKKLYRNFAKELVGVDVKIKVNDSWWYQHQNDFIGVANCVENEEDEKIVADFFAEFLGQSNLDYSLFTIGFLHELGHFWSKKVYCLSNEFFIQNLNEVQALEIFYSLSLELTPKEYYKQYAQIETEKLANDFLALAIKNKNKIVRKYDDIFYKIYGM